MCSLFFSTLAPIVLSSLVFVECCYCPTTPEELLRYRNEYIWQKLYSEAGRNKINPDESVDTSSQENIPENLEKRQHNIGPKPIPPGPLPPQINLNNTSQERRNVNRRSRDWFDGSLYIPSSPLPGRIKDKKSEDSFHGYFNQRLAGEMYLDIWKQLDKMRNHEENEQNK